MKEVPPPCLGPPASTDPARVVGRMRRDRIVSIRVCLSNASPVLPRRYERCGGDGRSLAAKEHKIAVLFLRETGKPGALIVIHEDDLDELLDERQKIRDEDAIP